MKRGQQQSRSPRWQWRRMRRPQWHEQRPWGYHGHHDCDPTDWPTGRNIQTTGRSTPLENIQRRRCTNRDTHRYKELFFRCTKKYQKCSAENPDMKSKFLWKTYKGTKRRQQNKKGSPVAICSNDHKLFSKPPLLCFPEEWRTVNCVMYSWWMFNFIRICNVILPSSTLLFTHHLLCATQWIMHVVLCYVRKTGSGLSHITPILRGFVHAAAHIQMRRDNHSECT